MNTCDHPGTNHSSDRVTLFYGGVEPLHTCGYHAGLFTAGLWRPFPSSKGQRISA